MGFFSKHNASAWDMLANFAVLASRKLLFIALGWVVVYFATQLIRDGALSLFNLLVGSLAGLVIGWTMGEDAVSESGLTGLTLWVLLTVLGVLPILVVEAVMWLITHWPMGMGRWMCIGTAGIMTMASAVWRASVDD